MQSPIKQICGHTDHFWYPEIKKHLDHSIKNPLQPLNGIDVKKLYEKKPNSFCHIISIFVLKIFHHIRLSFSKSYKANFEHSVEVLIDTESKIKAALIMQKARKHVKFMRGLKQHKEKEKLEKAKEVEAVLATQNVIRMLQIRQPFKSLRDKLHEGQKTIENEASVVNILTQFEECNKTIQQLDEKKPVGLTAIFKNESKENRKTRKNAIARLQSLQEDIQKNALMSEGFKKQLLEEHDVVSLIELSKNERGSHENMVKANEKIVTEVKEEIYNLGSLLE